MFSLNSNFNSFNDKSFSSSKYNNIIISYITSIEPVSTGNQLKIRTDFGTNRSLSKGKTIIPTIPYRLMMHATLPGSDSLMQIFNPGGIGLDHTINTFYQFNIARDYKPYLPNAFVLLVSQIDANTKQTQVVYNFNPYFSDMSASMIIVNNGNIDDIYLGVVTRVDAFYDMEILSSTGAKHKSYEYSFYYSVPVVLKYQIDRTQLLSEGDYKIDPVAWGYPHNISDWSSGKYNYGLGIQGLTGEVDHLFNYDLIPSERIVNIPNQTVFKYFKPINRGCLIDLAYDSSTGYLFSSCSIGVKTSSGYSNISNIKRFSLSSGYNSGTNINTLYDHTLQTSNISILKVCSDVFAGKLYTSTWGYNGSSSNTVVNIINCSTGVKQISHLFGGELPSVTHDSSGVICSLTSHLSKKYFFRIYDVSSTDNFRWYFENSDIKSNGNTSHNQFTYFKPITYIPNLFVIPSVSSTDSYVGSNISLDKSPYANPDSRLYNQTIVSHSEDNFIYTDIFYSNIKSFPISTSMSGTYLSQLPQYNNIIYSNNDSLGSLYDYVYYDKSLDLVEYNFQIPIELSSATVTPEYWWNPTLTENAEGSSELDSIDGVRLYITLYNISGFFSQPLSSSSFDDSLTPSYINSTAYPPNGHGGVALDSSKTRSDLNFIYSGNKAFFNHTSKSGYWTHLTSDGVAKLSMLYNGKSILIDSADKYLDPVIWAYSDNGMCNLSIHARLNLTNISGDDTTYFNSSTFSMTGVILKFDLLNKFKGLIASTGDKIINIVPPTPSGYINVSSKKTISSINFNVFRVATYGTNFTTIRRAIVEKFSNKDNLITNGPVYNFLEKNVSNTSIISVNSDILSTGDYVRVKYEPLLHDLKPSSPPIQYTNIVNNVKGHRYHITSSNIYFKNSITNLYESSANSLISSNNPYVHIDAAANNSKMIKVTISCNHEVWGARDMPDLDVYPHITNAYLYAAGKDLFPEIYKLTVLSSTINIKMYETPSINEVGYTNVSLDGALFIKNLFDASSIPNGSYTAPLNSINLSNVDIELTVTQSKDYMLYLFIKDEFNQLSCFCLTNIDNYSVPFKR